MVILKRGSLIGKGRGMRTALLCNSLLIHPQCGDNVYRFFVCFFHGGLLALVEDDVGGSGSEAVHYSPSHISNLAGNRATHFCLRAGGRAEGWSAGKRLGCPDGSYRKKANQRQSSVLSVGFAAGPPNEDHGSGVAGIAGNLWRRGGQKYKPAHRTRGNPEADLYLGRASVDVRDDAMQHTRILG